MALNIVLFIIMLDRSFMINISYIIYNREEEVVSKMQQHFAEYFTSHLLKAQD